MTKLTPLENRYRSAVEKEKYVKQLFAEIDDHYDFMNRFMSLGMDMSWRRRAIRAAGFAKNARLLDMAAGTGDLTISAFKIHPEARLAALDFCTPLLTIACKKFSRFNGKYSVEWINGNGLELPFADNSFDGVITAFSLRNVSDVNQLFAEFYRVTRSGGKVMSLEMVKPHTRLQKMIFAIHHQRIVPLLGRLISSFPDAYSYLPLSIENFYTADELSQVIASQGWKNVSYQPMMMGFIAAHLGTKNKTIH